MFEAVDSPYLVRPAGRFSVDRSPTEPPEEAGGKKAQKMALQAHIHALADQQRRLYAQDEWAVLLIFQAMDAAGKDSTIRAVMSGVNPAGCEVHSFKKPSSEELDHDFLWRSARRLPQRGRIGIFNRSYYEETLVVRVHPGILDGQKLPGHRPPLTTIWQQRYESIVDHEKHLARNGTVILKFWLNVSPDEQKKRFLSRIDEPAKNWKFSAADLAERQRWPDYMAAYEDVINATSTSHAPWYAIPADNKPFMRATVAGIVVDALQSLDLAYPDLPDSEKENLADSRERLLAEE